MLAWKIVQLNEKCETVFMFCPGNTAKRYEASTVADADDVCFTFPIETQRNENFVVDYAITSQDISVRMDIRSTASNAIVQSRQLPVRFKQLYEDGKNLTESYEIDFCASSEMMSDSTDISAPASAVIIDVKYVLYSSGNIYERYLFSSLKWNSRNATFSKDKQIANKRSWVYKSKLHLLDLLYSLLYDKSTANR